MNFASTFSGIDAALINIIGDAALLDGQPVQGIYAKPGREPSIGALRTNIEEPVFIGQSTVLAAAIEGSLLEVCAETLTVVNIALYDSDPSMIMLILRSV